MKQFESEHYIFHFNEGSKAEKDIHQSIQMIINRSQYLYILLEKT